MQNYEYLINFCHYFSFLLIISQKIFFISCRSFQDYFQNKKFLISVNRNRKHNQQMALQIANKINMALLAFFLIVSLNAQHLGQIMKIGSNITLQRETKQSMAHLKKLLKKVNFADSQYTQHLYQTVKEVAGLLSQLKKSVPFNDIIDGNGNKVQGSNIVVIGSQDTITGKNDWVFASNYKSNYEERGIIIFGNYRIDLSKISYIQTYPTLCITNISGDQFDKLYDKFVEKSRQHRVHMVSD